VVVVSAFLTQSHVHAWTELSHGSPNSTLLVQFHFWPVFCETQLMAPMFFFLRSCLAFSFLGLNSQPIRRFMFLHVAS